MDHLSLGHTSRGKWSEGGVPHRGWTCRDIDDLGEPSQTCEMCESVEIRYVHYMEHPDYPGILAVGCICAEHMEEDYVGPKQREQRLKAVARRRVNWARRKWRTSVAGNIFLNTECYNLTVYPAADSAGWKVAVLRRATLDRREGRRVYPSREAAKGAGFNALLWAKENLSPASKARPR